MPRYWFRAKRYGWGWGLPLTWEGWAALGAFLLLLVADAVALPPARHPAPFAVGVIVLASALLAICWRKGEPPASRRFRPPS